MKAKIWIGALAILLLSACPAPEPSPEPEATADFSQPTSATPAPAAWVIPAAPTGSDKATIALGEQIFRQTAQYLGPEVKDPAKRAAGNHLSCSSCHLQAGQGANALGLLGVSQRYPVYRGRENRIGNLTERINGCFERSMNGQPLDEATPEMQALLAYLNWLSQDSPADGKHVGQGLPEIDLLERAADPKLGAGIYQQRCQSCHQDKGQGLAKNAKVLAEGYLYPPLWGNDSFNDGAGMHRLIKAAQFIKANMPLGQADLSTADAFDVAAYINSQPRPHLAKRAKDYPDISKKPIDAPYPPFADKLSAEQHKLGPFAEMQK